MANFNPLPDEPPIPPKRHQVCPQDGKNINNIPFNIGINNNDFINLISNELNINAVEMINNAGQRGRNLKISTNSIYIGGR